MSNHFFSILAITPARSSTDLPNTVGNTARRDNGSLLYSEEHPVESQAYQQNPYSQQRLCWWESNYKEASIFLEVFYFNTVHLRSIDTLESDTQSRFVCDPNIKDDFQNNGYFKIFIENLQKFKTLM